MRLLLERGELSRDRQRQAFELMVNLHLYRALSYPEKNKIRDLVIGDKDLPTEIRANAYWRACVDASFDQRDGKRLAELADHPTRQELRKDLREEGMESLATLAGAIESESSEVAGRVEEMVKDGPLSSLDTAVIKGLSGLLIEREAEQERKQLMDLLKEARFAPDSGQTARRMRLESIRQLRAFERERKDGVLLYEAFEDRVKELSTRAEEGWQERSDFVQFPDLSSEAVAEVMAAAVESDFKASRGSNDAWVDMAQGLLTEEKALRPEAFATYLETIGMLEQEDLAGRLMIELVGGIDPGLEGYEATLEVVEKWYAKEKPGPLRDVGAVILLGARSEAVEEGELEALVRRHLVSQTPVSRVLRLFLAGVLVDRNKEDLAGKLLDGLSDDELFSPYTGPLYVRVLRWAGRDDEAELLTEHLEEKLRELWMTAWETGVYGDYQMAIRSVRSLQLEPDELGVWVEELPKLYNIPEERKEAESLVALVRHDWKRLVELVAEVRKTNKSVGAEALEVLAFVKLGHDGAREKGKEILRRGILVNPFYFDLLEALED